MSFAKREEQRQKEIRVWRQHDADRAGMQRIAEVDKMRELSDRFGVSSVPRLVEVAMRQGLGGKIKDMYKTATDVLSRKADGQVPHPPQQQRGGAVASEGEGRRWQIDVGNMVNFAAIISTS